MSVLALYATEAATTFPDESRSWMVLLLTVVGSSASLNCTVMEVLVLTPLALLAGVTDVTVGGVSAGAAVVKEAEKLAAKGVSAASLMTALLLPP